MNDLIINGALATNYKEEYIATYLDYKAKEKALKKLKEKLTEMDDQLKDAMLETNNHLIDTPEIRILVKPADDTAYAETFDMETFMKENFALYNKYCHAIKKQTKSKITITVRSK